MIISHKHKFIFVKTKKTAGTSIETLLASICGEEDIITEISEEEFRKEKFGISSQNILVPTNRYTIIDWLRLIFYRRRKKFTAHMSSIEIIRYIGHKKWKEYYTFCYDRNPIDKTKSMFNWKGGLSKYSSFDEFLRKHRSYEISNWNFYTKNNNIILDRVYNLDHLDETLIELSKRFNVKWKYSINEIKFKTNIRKYNFDITSQHIKKIKKIHAKEINLLGYDI
tara:strand:+ start:4782 stop:5453 length:672 start_codon:yes stop_codon:yes gene_type:complete